MPDPLPRVSARLVLRRLAASDLRAFQAYRHIEAVGCYQAWAAQSDADALAFLEQMGEARLFVPGEWVQLAIAERESDSLIGDIGICVAGDGLRAEIGFTLQPRSQGRGLATEAVRETIGLLFEHTRVDQVIGITDARNVASIRLLERVGMRRIVTADAVFRGEPCVEHSYAIARRDRG